MKQVEMSPLTPQGGRLTGYIHDAELSDAPRGPRPAVLVIPGGGYRKLVGREREPVAFDFFAAGFNTFLLDYTVRDQQHPEPVGQAPLAQALRALALIRENARDWNTRPNQVAVLGFSAGGHLAGSCAVLWNRPGLTGPTQGDPRLCRPDAAVLCYPATFTTGPYHHPGSVRSLTGEEDCSFFDLPSQVNGDTPPCFLWSTVEDERVPAQNTLAFAQALQEKGVPYELHLYTRGQHGLALGKAESGQVHPHLASWVRLCKEWLGELFDFAVSV